MSDLDPRAQVREWVLERGEGLTPETLAGDTPLLEGRHLSAPQVPELLLFIEAVRGQAIDVKTLRAGDLRDLDTICNRYFGAQAAIAVGHDGTGVVADRYVTAVVADRYVTAVVADRYVTAVVADRYVIEIFTSFRTGYWFPNAH